MWSIKLSALSKLKHWRYRTLSQIALVLLIAPLTIAVSCGSVSAPYQKERELQNVLYLGQRQAAIIEYLKAEAIYFRLSENDQRLVFGLQRVSFNGLVEVGIGVTVRFETDKTVSSYEVRRNLTGP